MPSFPAKPGVRARGATSLALLGLCLAAALPLGLNSQTAEARVEDSSAYSKAQTFSGALRYLRVDLGYEIVEKDPDAAYLLFKYVPSGQREPTNGSIEIVQSEGRVKVFVQLPRMPEYHERMLSTGLAKKLKAEYGEPPAPAKKPTKKPAKKPDDRDDKQPDGSGAAASD